MCGGSVRVWRKRSIRAKTSLIDGTLASDVAAGSSPVVPMTERHVDRRRFGQRLLVTLLLARRRVMARFVGRSFGYKVVIFSARPVGGRLVERQLTGPRLLEVRLFEGGFLDGRLLDRRFLDRRFVRDGLLKGQLLGKPFLDRRLLNGRLLDDGLLDDWLVDGRLLDRRLVERRLFDGLFADRQIVRWFLGGRSFAIYVVGRPSSCGGPVREISIRRCAFLAPVSPRAGFRPAALRWPVFDIRLFGGWRLDVRLVDLRVRTRRREVG